MRARAAAAVAERLVEAVTAQVEVVPSLIHGEGEVIISLKKDVLDGSEIRLTAKGGDIAVEITASTPEAARVANAASSRLETALAEHVASFRHVTVSVVRKKGKSNEAA